MRTKLLLVAACTLLYAPFSHAQTATTCPSTKTIDELIKAIDDAVSGPGDKDRTCMRQLFVSDGRLIPIAKAKDGSIAARILTVDDWINRVKARGSEPFYEHQIKYSTEVYDNLAHLWSTYEIRPTPDGKVEVRGINSIQAAFNGTEWKAVEIAWQAETSDTPIPQKYLP
ncbi:hypothetical protein H7849_00360 [Alloacidobacterium dinghuense]|uniref:DUF4440 domain-containing protein n=1 Tax=Alloacidobacterium dinghuense TaxID=2763107 RepID=A0A7G8BJ02_9BACT|nr:hypothetical protein [Alloacidobacterium dinghuense]QNI32522.1 hypothetical protein H7849_00360 [Alloacidobacterium dinghuense]